MNIPGGIPSGEHTRGEEYPDPYKPDSYLFSTCVNQSIMQSKQLFDIL